jgi:hypothetical protein
MKTLLKKYDVIKSWPARVQYLWRVLTWQAAEKRLVTYTRLAYLVKIEHDSEAQFIQLCRIIDRLCEVSSIPILNTIVVNNYGECASRMESHNLAHHQQDVFKFPWTDYRIPSRLVIREVYQKLVEANGSYRLPDDESTDD